MIMTVAGNEQITPLEFLFSMSERELRTFMSYFREIRQRHFTKHKRKPTHDELIKFVKTGFDWIISDRFMDYIKEKIKHEDDEMKSFFAGLCAELDEMRCQGRFDNFGTYEMKQALKPMIKRQYESQVNQIRHAMQSPGADIAALIRERKEIDDKWLLLQNHLDKRDIED